MERSGSRRGSATPRVVAALLALLLIGVLWRTLEHGTLRPPAGAPAPADSDADIERALALARAGMPPASGSAPGGAPHAWPDSTAIKNAWHDDVTGFESERLTPAQHELFVRFANAERCTCGCGYTLAGCLASDMTCEISRASAAALLDSVRSGRISSARGVRRRPASGG